MNNFDWLHDQTKDESFALNDTARWMTESPPAEEFFKYINPHAKYYHTPLNGLFLFLIREFSLLSHFDKVFVRDGLVSLMLFFLRHPNPGSLKTKLIINYNFRMFIPKAWKENVLFYSYKFELKKNKSNRDNLILICHPDNLHSPLDFVKNKLQDLPSHEHVYCLITDPRISESNGHISNATFNIIKSISLGLKGTLTNVTLDELPTEVIANSNFAEINPHCFLYSDCFIRWSLLNNGSLPIEHGEPAYNKENVLTNLPLSPNHSLDIIRADNLGDINITSKERDIFSEDLIELDDDPPLNLCSNSFKRYVFDFIKNEKNSR